MKLTRKSLRSSSASTRSAAPGLATAMALAFLLSLGASPVRAQPAGGQVVAGAANFSGGPGALTITQASGRAIINWQDFSTGAGELVKFVQPSVLSAILNRVVSDRPSTLFGSLEANGQVFLLNPNGILVGAGARIDAGGFLASTLNVGDADFMRGGDLFFRGDSDATIQNLGTINALGGDVFLIARRVENAGTISAARGTAALAAGSEVLLTTGGSERVFVQAASSPGALASSGTITAATVELKAAGGNAYALAINNSGVVRATGSAVRNGEVWLVAAGDSTVTNSGTLDASSTTGAGGRVVVTGGRILLDAGARLDATGATGGGEILVGGGWQGKDAAIQNASAVVMQPGATIDVSATQSGNAGTAVLWSQDYTAFHGNIAAKGGPNGGNGGNVETSSHLNLQAFGLVEAKAANGLAGSWMLDPQNVSIASAGASGTAYAPTFIPTADSVILASSIVDSLNGGSNVTITTGATGASAGDINVDTVIAWNANRTLTLSAFHDINVNADIIATGATAGLVLTPNTVGDSDGRYFLNNGASITLSGLTPSLTIAGLAYTVINSLGVAGDATIAPATPTLQGIAALTNLGGRYALGSNIYASATATWNAGEGFAPIGYYDDFNEFHFTGILDGLGHVICDLTINRPEAYVALFGLTAAGSEIRNLGLVGGSVTGLGGAALVWSGSGSISRSYSTMSVSGNGGGGLVGGNFGSITDSYATGTLSIVDGGGGLVGDNSGTITNSYSTSSVLNGGGGVGGLAGYNFGTITNSYATGNVSAFGSVGGLVGANKGPISDSFATGGVTGLGNFGTNAVGGLAGSNQDSAISNSYATGNVNGGTLGDVGGLVGYDISGTYTNSYATGSVSGRSFVGGLVGHTDSDTTISNSYATGNVNADGIFIGGLIGANNGTAFNNYATGSVINTGVNAGSMIGGLIGINYGGTTSDNYWNSSVNPTLSGIWDGNLAGATGLTTAQMRTAASFTGFTFTTTPGASGNNWVIVDTDGTLNNEGTVAGATFPMLASEYATTIRGAHQLQLMQMAPAASYELGRSITVEATGGATDVWDSSGFVPVGRQDLPFGGTLDGLGRTISGLVINRPAVDSVGLFGVTGQNSEIRNVALLGGSVSGDSFVGGLAGVNLGTISNSYTTGSVTGTANVGGLVGLNSSATTVTDSYAAGEVSGTINVGGLVGNNSGGTISNSYAKASVTGAEHVGGLVGSNRFGAVSASFWNSTINAIGIGDDAEIGDSPGATGMTATQMLQLLNFSSATNENGNTNPEWDLASTWIVYDGHTDPLLRVFMTPLTVVALDHSKIYNGLPYTGGGVIEFCCGDESLLFGTAGIGGTAQGAVNVGGYAITPSGLWSNQQGYVISYVDGALTVNKANLTLSGTQAYNGATAYAGGNLTAIGVNGESFEVTGAGAAGNLTTKNVQTAQLLASVNGLLLGSGNIGAAIAANYNNLTTTGSSVSVTPKVLTISGFASNDKVFDDNTAAVIATPGTLSGVLGEDFVNFTSTGATFDTKNVGAGKTVTLNGVTLTGLGDQVNYSYTATTTDLSDITAATPPPPPQVPLTISADAKSKTYGAALPAFTASFAGFINGDTASNVTGLQFSTAATISSNVGTFAITPFGATAPSSYIVGYVPGTLTINPATLTLSANSASKTYGAPLPTLASTISGLVNGDTASVVSGVTLATPATPASNVGAYAITVAGGTASNYAINHVAGTLTVNPAALTITADDKSRSFGAANPALTATFTGLVNSDGSSVVGGLLLSTTATPASNVGSHPIVAAGATASNYAITFVSGTLAIGQSPLTITADNQAKIYGAALPAFTASFAGLLNGDTPAIVTGLQFGTTGTAGSNVGTFAITPSGATAPNYAVAFVPGSLTINPAALAIAANNATRIYGATNPTLGANFTGFVNGDAASVVSGLSIATPATAASGVGSYAITPSGASAANYTITHVPGALVVTPAALVITAGSASKTYGAINPAFSATSTGFVNGDASSGLNGLTLTTPATTASGVGSYAVMPGGVTAANYTVTFMPGALTINRAALTVTADDAARDFGDANPAFTAVLSGLVNGDSASVMSGLAFNTPATTGSAVGSYAITPSGASAANYVFTFVNGALTITAPSFVLNDVPTNVVTVDGVPVVTPELTVIPVGDHFILIGIDGQGGAIGNPTSPSVSLDGQLTAELSDSTSLPRFGTTISSPEPTLGGGAILPNTGRFEIVFALGGGAGGSSPAGDGGLTAAQLNEPGLFRESAVSMGKYNIIYHEALADARQQTADNTALGSSYREFLDTESPRVDIVRDTAEGQPGDDPVNPANPGRTP